MKILRSDNAKEYFSSSFKNFITEHDITYQSSYAYTQQNGIAEHKNCYLLETACALLIHRKVSKYFWSDAVVTCYLINKIPFSVLKNQIPYSVSCPQNDLFSMLPNILCFVWNNNSHKTKLDFHALKCIFLVFSNTERISAFLPFT